MERSRSEHGERSDETRSGESSTFLSFPPPSNPPLSSQPPLPLQLPPGYQTTPPSRREQRREQRRGEGEQRRIKSKWSGGRRACFLICCLCSLVIITISLVISFLVAKACTLFTPITKIDHFSQDFSGKPPRIEIKNHGQLIFQGVEAHEGIPSIQATGTVTTHSNRTSVLNPSFYSDPSSFVLKYSGSNLPCAFSDVNVFLRDDPSSSQAYSAQLSAASIDLGGFDFLSFSALTLEAKGSEAILRDLRIYGDLKINAPQVQVISLKANGNLEIDSPKTVEITSTSATFLKISSATESILALNSTFKEISINSSSANLLLRNVTLTSSGKCDFTFSTGVGNIVAGIHLNGISGCNLSFESTLGYMNVTLFGYTGKYSITSPNEIHLDQSSCESKCQGTIPGPSNTLTVSSNSNIFFRFL